MKDKINLRPLAEQDTSFILEWMNDNDIAARFQCDMKKMVAEDVNEFIKNTKANYTMVYLGLSSDGYVVVKLFGNTCGFIIANSCSGFKRSLVSVI